jgi:hypothetical protein
MLIAWRSPIGFFAAVAIFLAAGCSNGIKATGAWKEPRPADAPYQRVLVIGVSPESRMRRSFEEQMTDALNATGGTRVTASIFVGSEMNTASLSKDTVIAMIGRIGADAVLVTRMVGHNVTQGETREEAILKIGPTITIEQEVGVTAVWVSDFSLTQVPGQIEANEDAMIESTVYDVGEKGRPVYQISIEDKFKNASADIIPDVAGDLAAVIARELHRDGVVR